MPLLIHAAGESDLLLSYRDVKPAERAEKARDRREAIRGALAEAGGIDQVRRMLAEGVWGDQVEARTDDQDVRSPSPLLTALAAIAAEPGVGGQDAEVDVVLLGTRQDPPEELDSIETAEILAAALTAGLADGTGARVRSAIALTVAGMSEDHVIESLSGFLDQGTSIRGAQQDQANLITWGSGAGALPLGAMTALAQAGMSWLLVAVGEGRAACIVDPLGEPAVDPVVATLLRWRLFGELLGEDAEARGTRLTDAQRNLMRAAVERRARGFERCEASDLRAVLADALVRRDGTAPMAVRRYIVSRYDELFQADRREVPGACHLLDALEWRKGGGPPLGWKIRDVKDVKARKGIGKRPRKGGARADVAREIRASLDFESCEWLISDEVAQINEVGKCSHRLRQPSVEQAAAVAEHLGQWDDIDGIGWSEAGLLAPPLLPADRVTVVWVAGNRPNAQDAIACQLIAGRLPSGVRTYLDVEHVRIDAQIFGVPGDGGSLDLAEADARYLRDGGHRASVAAISCMGGDEKQAETAIEAQVTEQTGALLLIPVGYKGAVLTVFGASRRVAARRGLPLFVRQIDKPPAHDLARTRVYRWPALTGGDLPLLVAARSQMETLELDVAWRLLSASAADPDTIGKAERLAMAFASRNVEDDVKWSVALASNTLNGLVGRTLGMVAQRISLVRAALDQATTAAERIRLLVLAADVIEASVAATRPGDNLGRRYGEFRKGLEEIATNHNPDGATARILLLLNAARDQASITHGPPGEADKVVAEQADRLAGEWGLAAPHGLPRNVSALIEAAVAAAIQRGLGQPDQVDDLCKLRDELIALIDTEIEDRKGRTRRPDAATGQH